MVFLNPRATPWIAGAKWCTLPRMGLLKGESTMRMKHLLLSTAAGAAVALMTAGLGAVAAQAQATLSGQVTSPQGPMEGVLVTAKKAGSTIAYTVVSDAQGRYSFPAGKIDARRIYAAHPRRPGSTSTAPARTARSRPTVDAQKTHHRRPQAQEDRATSPAQLTNAEWLMSMPGTDDQKAQLLELRRLPHPRAHRALHPRRR